jgi:hypothetical protein
MKSPRGTASLPHLVCFTIVLCLIFTVQASIDSIDSSDSSESSDSSDSSICTEVRWMPGQFMKREHSDSNSTSTSADSSSGSISSPSSTPVAVPINTGNITAGEVSCLFADSTEGLDINYYTCTLLANKWGISVENFFTLNPGLNPDCSNIQPDTDYCVLGCES